MPTGRHPDEAWQDLMEVLDEATKARWRAEIIRRHPAARAKLRVDKQADSAQAREP